MTEKSDEKEKQPSASQDERQGARGRARMPGVPILSPAGRTPPSHSRQQVNTLTPNQQQRQGKPVNHRIYAEMKIWRRRAGFTAESATDYEDGNVLSAAQEPPRPESTQCRHQRTHAGVVAPDRQAASRFRYLQGIIRLAQRCASVEYRCLHWRIAMAIRGRHRRAGEEGGTAGGGTDTISAPMAESRCPGSSTSINVSRSTVGVS